MTTGMSPEKPKVTHLGMVRGNWPVYAFTSATQAASWATQERPLHEVRLVWEVLDLNTGPAMVGTVVPSRNILEEVDVA